MNVTLIKDEKLIECQFQVLVGPRKSKKRLPAIAGIFSFFEMENSDKKLLTFIKIHSLNDLNFLPTLITFVL